MPTQYAPDAALRHDRRLAALTGIAAAAARRAWRKLDARGAIEDQYATEVGPQLTAVMLAAQVAAARESDDYLPRVLRELAFPKQRPLGRIVPQSMAGWAGDGRPVDSLFASNIGGVRIRAAELRGDPTPTVRTVPDVEDPLARLFAGDQTMKQALDEFERTVNAQVVTLIADTARAFEGVGMAATPSVTHFVRMIEPGACSRCVVLAGRRYKLSEGFDRHPDCRCTHIPATLAATDTVVSSPEAYFDSLTPAEQDQVFTPAGAQAIRDGADISQVVNARRGMERAQVYGHDVLITSEGATRRGVGYKALNARFRDADRDTRRFKERYRRTTNVRLMPESILAVAGDDVTERVRLLKLHGYLA